jgi:hypothetical protein
MKIIEQYLHEIKRRLPLKSREDTTEELRSLLLDELEKRYGSEATEEQAKELLAGFGPPNEVARRYSGGGCVVAPALSDLYFLILWIVLGAMAIAFTTVFFVKLVTGGIENGEIVAELLRLPLSVLTAFLSGAGAVTLIFIGITRLGWNDGLNPQDDWTPEELKGVVVEPETESRFAHIFSIGMGIVGIIVLTVFPQVITLIEEAILGAGLRLGHQLNIQLFSNYVIVISMIILGEIVHRVMVLRIGENTPILRLGKTGIALANIVLSAVMLGDMRLYLDYEGFLGFRLLLLIALIGGIIELITELVAYGKIKAARTSVGLPKK